MRIFVFLHVLGMFTAVATAYGPAFLMHRAAATRHVPTIRGVFSMAKVTGPLIPVFFLSGFAFALIAIFTEGFNPFRPWLLIAYVLFAIGLFTGRGPGQGRVRGRRGGAQRRPRRRRPRPPS